MAITMIDARKASQGYVFINYGTPEDCLGCSLLRVCAGNLESRRKYRVKAVRDKEHECNIAGRVRVVEVEEEASLGAISKLRAYLGAKVEYEPVSCSKIFCENYKYCVPEGLKEGDNCRVEEVLKNLECGIGLNLQLVTLKRG